MSVHLPDRVSARPTVPALRRIPEWREVLVCLLVVYARVAHAEELVGKVVVVADRYTLTILVGKEAHRVRLAVIDAPGLSDEFPVGLAGDTTGVGWPNHVDEGLGGPAQGD